MDGVGHSAAVTSLRCVIAPFDYCNVLTRLKL